MDEVADTELEYSSNDTKEDALLYFVRVSNYFLRLVKNSPVHSICGRHPMKFPVIADNGANYHMF